tara:strand:- start:847 stop:1605 length:759 start_codon:yes stop_codon:yes gene_type:complete
MATGTLATISIISAAVGTGVSVYGQAQARKTASAMAAYNASQQEREAQTQLAAMQAQATIAEQTAENNFRLRESEANARFANAQAIEDDILNRDAVSRLNLRKSKEDSQRLQATQRATIAASGAVESSGTPLDILAETASVIQQDREEQSYIHENERRTLFNQAGQERLGGQFALAGATMDRSSALASSELHRATGAAQARRGSNAANLTRLAGENAATNSRYNSAATLLSGVNSASADRYQYNQHKPAKTS